MEYIESERVVPLWIDKVSGDLNVVNYQEMNKSSFLKSWFYRKSNECDGWKLKISRMNIETQWKGMKRKSIKITAYDTELSYTNPKCIPIGF